MRVLLDECLPARLRRDLPGHEVKLDETRSSANPVLLINGFLSPVGRGVPPAPFDPVVGQCVSPVYSIVERASRPFD